MIKSSLGTLALEMKCPDEWYDLLALGDWHVGQRACDERGIRKMVEYIASKDPARTGVVLTGDLIENVHPSSKGSLYEMVHPSPDDQMDIVVELLTPIKKHILCMCDGNHEYRTERIAGTSPSRSMATRLGLKYFGYRGVLNLTVRRPRSRRGTQNYLTYVEHGTGSIPKTVGGRYNKLAATQKNAVADIYIKGHIHHKLAFPKTVWRMVGGKMIKRKTMFASNGSYLIDPDYAIRADFEPTEPGVAKLMLATERYDIHCSV